MTPGGVAKRTVACNEIGSCGRKQDGFSALLFATFRAENIKLNKQTNTQTNTQTNLVAALRWLGPALRLHPSGADRIPTPSPICSLCSCQVLLLLLRKSKNKDEKTITTMTANKQVPKKTRQKTAVATSRCVTGQGSCCYGDYSIGGWSSPPPAHQPLVGSPPD